MAVKSFDKYNPKGYQKEGTGKCGTSGQKNGLQFSYPKLPFSITGIPYNEPVEVLFTVENAGLCTDYEDVQVMLISTCEIPTSNSQVYQYGTSYDSKTNAVTVLYDSAHLRHASNSTASFTVRWPEASSSSSSRRLSNIQGNRRGGFIDQTHTNASNYRQLKVENELATVKEELLLLKDQGKVLKNLEEMLAKQDALFAKKEEMLAKQEEMIMNQAKGHLPGWLIYVLLVAVGSISVLLFWTLHLLRGTSKKSILSASEYNT
jgi:hypothetical protein